MKFREAIDADLEVYLQLEEYGEEHDVNGQVIPCVIQRMTREKSGNETRNYSGLHGDFMTLHFRTIMLDSLPQQGENMRIDGRRYTVDNVEDMLGMTRVILSAYRGRGL